jgi:Sugar phosphate isomerases/epimerases
LKIGVLVHLNNSINTQLEELSAMGIKSCQLVCWDQDKMTNDTAQLVKAAAGKLGITITAFWCGWPGPVTWDFYDGQITLGLVVPEYRNERLKILLQGSHFAKQLGVNNLITHVGFLPENPYDENYRSVIAALKVLVQTCQENDQNFLFETGQETPVTLRRAIEDIGMSNIGVNFDPANLLMYGKANPIDALDILGKYVLGVHGKDGLYPTDGSHLGKEMPLGQGRVNYPLFIAKLREVGYCGDITIEREIEGEEQKKDILAAKALLEELLGN